MQNKDKYINSFIKTFGIKKNKLRNLYKNNIFKERSNILIEYKPSILKIYTDKHNKYIIIGEKKQDTFYAVKIIE